MAGTWTQTGKKPFFIHRFAFTPGRVPAQQQQKPANYTETNKIK
jgi:hypothetical protein